jgi:molybdate transport system substrate-binding protein
VSVLRRQFATGLAAAALCSQALQPLHAQAVVANLAAASDLKFAIEEVAVRFEKDTGQKIRLVFGSSGNFKTQILQGAPFHLFMSADENFVYELADAGKTEDRGRTYAVGRIVIMVPSDGVLKPDGQLRDLAAALKDGRLKKFAIGNPEHAPYGARGKDALEHAGLWHDIRSKLVLGENISQAAQFAVSGSAEGGIVAYSLALAPNFAGRAKFELIPESWHKRLVQRMVLVRGAPPAARAFYEYLATPAAQEIMVRYGFAMPKD